LLSKGILFLLVIWQLILKTFPKTKWTLRNFLDKVAILLSEHFCCTQGFHIKQNDEKNPVEIKLMNKPGVLYGFTNVNPLIIFYVFFIKPDPSCIAHVWKLLGMFCDNDFVFSLTNTTIFAFCDWWLIFARNFIRQILASAFPSKTENLSCI